MPVHSGAHESSSHASSPSSEHQHYRSQEEEQGYGPAPRGPYNNGGNSSSSSSSSSIGSRADAAERAARLEAVADAVLAALAAGKTAIVTVEDGVLVCKPDLKKTYVLRRILNPMGTIDAIEFLLDKLRQTKSNSDFFDSMNA